MEILNNQKIYQKFLKCWTFMERSDIIKFPLILKGHGDRI